MKIDANSIEINRKSIKIKEKSIETDLNSIKPMASWTPEAGRHAEDTRKTRGRHKIRRNNRNQLKLIENQLELVKNQLKCIKKHLELIENNQR